MHFVSNPEDYTFSKSFVTNVTRVGLSNICYLMTPLMLKSSLFYISLNVYIAIYSTYASPVVEARR